MGTQFRLSFLQLPPLQVPLVCGTPKTLVLVLILQRKHSWMYIYTKKEIYFKELVHTFVEAGKSKIFRGGSRLDREPRRSQNMSPENIC